MDPQLLALLIVVATLLIWRAAGRERRDYAQFKRMRTTAARQKVMRKWLLESVFIMGGLSGAVLLATSDILATTLAEMRAWAPMTAITDFFTTSSLGTGLVIGAAIGSVIAVVVPLWILRRSATEEGADAVPTIGDISALIPRTRGELGYGFGLSVSAGVFEELLFRLAMPALLFGVGLPAPLAFLLAVLLFGALHLYQKTSGVIMATVLGLIFTLLYVVSGTILLPIIVHVLFDLRSLVLLPLVIGRVWNVRR